MCKDAGFHTISSFDNETRDTLFLNPQFKNERDNTDIWQYIQLGRMIRDRDGRAVMRILLQLQNEDKEKGRTVERL